MPALKMNLYMYWLLLTTLVTFETLMVGGDYILNVTMLSYSSNGRCSQCNHETLHGCCDYWESTSCGSVGSSRRCDTYYQYCLLDPGTTFRLPITCNIRAQSTQTTSNGAAIDFSQSTVLGLSNPLTLSGNLPTYPGVILQIQAIDEDSSEDSSSEDSSSEDSSDDSSVGDSSADDLIDVFRLEINAKQGSVTMPGVYGLSTFGISYEVICAERYYGERCQLFNDCPTTDVCGPNGACVDGDNSYTCQCNPGYTGSTCTTAIPTCDSVDCSGHGQCKAGNGSITCKCDSGYTGAMCETNIDDCVGIDCGGRGSCVDGVNTYTCVCVAGFTGDSCTVDIDDCLGVTCGRNGQCVDGVNTFTCHCDPGFTGHLCETECSTTCQQNGVCADSLICDCDPGYTGASCEPSLKSICPQISCNNRDCSDQEREQMVCVCDPGYTGDRCQIDVDDCAEVDCGRNFLCVDGVNSYTCKCILETTSNGSCTAEMDAAGFGDDEHLRFGLVIGGTLGGFILILIIVMVLLFLCICRATRNQERKATGPVVKKGDRVSMTDNTVYGVPHTLSNEVIYEEIGSRRNGVYGGNPNELQSYAIYDVVL